MRDESLFVLRDRYIESTQKDQGTGNYARDADRVLANWLEWCRERNPSVTSTDDLTVLVLGKWAQDLKDRTHAGAINGSTAQTYYGIVSACLTWAVKWEYLDANPAHKQRAKDELPEASAGTSADTQFWNSEERTAFTQFVDRRAEAAVDERGLAAVPELRDRALVYLLAYSGARSAEVLRDTSDARRDGLQWRDVDLEEGVLTVLGKSQATEVVQLPEQARPAIARLETVLDPPGDNWPVFPTLHSPSLYGRLEDDPEIDDDHTVLDVLRDQDVSPPALTTDGARKLFRRLCAEGEIPVDGGHEYLTPHGARRGAGEAVYRGGDFEAAQRVLRHADPSTTSAMYSHIEAGELAEEATEAFERVDEG